MSLVIFSEAGYKFGFGHFYRMSGICETAIARGHDVKMYLVADDVAKQNLDRSYVSFTDWHEKEVYENILSDETTLVVDSYHVDIEELERLNDIAGNMIVIDDNMRLDYHDMSILNPNYFAKWLEYPDGKGNEYYLGKDYTLLRDEFNVTFDREVPDEVTDVLITMGGTDLKHMTVKAIKAVKSVSEYVRIHAVVTNAYSDLDEIESLIGPADKLYNDIGADVMSSLMRNCAFAVSSAGGTTNELIKTQCPSALVVVADNQVLNTKYLSEEGTIEVLEDDPEKVIAGMFSKEKRSSMAERLAAYKSDRSGKDLIYDIAFKGK